MSDLRSTWICPSRSRPHNIARLLGAWKSCHAAAHLIVAVDEDDPTIEEYDVAFAAYAPPNASFVNTGPRRYLGPTLNRLAVLEAKRGVDTVGFLGDDHIPRTLNFDRKLHNAIQIMGGGLAYGNDLIQGERIPTAVLQDAEIVRKLGYFHPPDLLHMYLDDYWKRLGRAIGKLCYLDDVIIEHAHYSNGSAPKDDLYAEVNDQRVYDRDEAVFHTYLRTEFYDALGRLA